MFPGFDQHNMEMVIKRVSGGEAAEYLPAVASLRIRVFREYPYLYDGSAADEREYLEFYRAAAASVMVLAMAGGEVVGASTGIPLAAAAAEFREPWERAGHDVGRVFYLGESVLLGAWRGRGIGHEFFNQREEHAAQHGFAETSFCAVERSADHPLRPAGYRALDGFWQKRGYRRDPALVARVAWQQVDQPGPVDNTLVFWRRGLSFG